MSDTAWNGFEHFWNGYGAGLQEAMNRYGGRLCGNIGAVKSLISNLTMAMIDYQNDPSEDNIRKIEGICVDIGANIGAGELGAFLGGLVTGGNPIGAIAGAAIGAAAASFFGNNIRDIYQILKEQGFEGIEWWMENTAPKPGRFSGMQDVYDAFYGGTTAAPPRRDPLIIDLDGDGIETVASTEGAFLIITPPDC